MLWNVAASAKSTATVVNFSVLLPVNLSVFLSDNFSVLLPFNFCMIFAEFLTDKLSDLFTSIELESLSDLGFEDDLPSDLRPAFDFVGGFKKD